VLDVRRFGITAIEGDHMSGGTTTATSGGAPDPLGGRVGAAAEALTFGPLKLSTGTTRSNISAYYWLALSSIMLFTFLPALQAPVLSTILGIPEDEQGRITGFLGLVAEIVLIVVVAWSAAWSDRVGRRIVAVLGYVLLGVGLVITPLIGNVLGLVGARAIAGIGIAMITGMITAIVTDYVRDETRGKANGFLGFCNGIGALITFTLLLQLPRAFEGLGMGEVGALRATYLVAAGIALGTALLLHFGLRAGKAIESVEEPPIRKLVREGLSAGRDPGLSLSYASAFVARADLALVGAFLILWAQQYGESTLGLSAGEATAKAGILLAAANGTALLVAPAIGILADRIGRTDAVLISLAVTAVGYTSTLVVENPFSPLGYTVAALIGFGQVSAVIASQVLVAEQAPPRIRGSVIGMFALFGGVGIMIALGAGGVLFDAWRPAGPFVLFGVTAAAVFVYGLTVRKKIAPNRYAEDDGSAAILV
jgi:MFS family permease